MRKQAVWSRHFDDLVCQSDDAQGLIKYPSSNECYPLSQVFGGCGWFDRKDPQSGQDLQGGILGGNFAEASAEWILED